MGKLPSWIRQPLEALQDRSRRRHIFAYLDAAGAGLEIGPCHNGVAPKREGFNVRILDHLDQEGLRSKYRQHGTVDLAKIEFVDYVWSGQRYSELIPDRRFDWIVARHVVEHIPDPILFFQDCKEILREKGRLFLVIPYCRREFDRFRFPSGSGEIVDAHLRGDVRPTPGAVAEHHLRACKKGGRVAWSWWWPGRLRKIHTDKEVEEAFEAARRGEYLDVHLWRFTPESFLWLLDDLKRLGMMDFVIVGRIHLSGSEFSVCLERVG